MFGLVDTPRELACEASTGGRSAIEPMLGGEVGDPLEDRCRIGRRLTFVFAAQIGRCLLSWWQLLS